MEKCKNKFGFLLVFLGVAFEHFDVMLVSLLASSIMEEFTSGANFYFKAIIAYLGYSIAFFFRPLGAFCFGLVGDFFGRKVALVSSMILISCTTLGMAFIPSVANIGYLSTFLFLICRAGQGLAVGGEYGTAMTFAYELNPNKRTFYGACIVASTHLGGVLASFLAAKYSSNFRFTFLVGGLLGVCFLLLRSMIKDNYSIKQRNILDIARASVSHSKAILQALVVSSMLVLVFYGSLIYLNDFIHQQLGIPRKEIFYCNAALLSLWIFIPPLIGYLIDKFQLPYKSVMQIGALGVFFSSFLLGGALLFCIYPCIFITQILLHLFHMIFCLCTPRYFGDLFSGIARNTSLSTSYSIGASYTAALAPALCKLTGKIFRTNFAICIPFMVIALIAIYILRKEYIYAKR